MENIFDKILKDQGLNYEDLSSAEKETYNRANFPLKTITVDDIKDYIIYMKNSIALQLSNTPEEEHFHDKEIFLKARIKNYILLEMFLTAPEKAEEAFRRQVSKKVST